jgi:hypothetical protein
LEKEDGANVVYLGKVDLNIRKYLEISWQFLGLPRKKYFAVWASLYSCYEFHDHTVINLWCEIDDDRPLGS